MESNEIKTPKELPKKEEKKRFQYSNTRPKKSTISSFS
jgi:hypothetical protein